MEWFIISGLTLGLAGSLHCLGMCGPIVLALPVAGYARAKQLIYPVLYHFGRSMAYVSMGALMGLLGKSFSFFGWQQWLSIFAGILMLAFYFLPKWTRLSGFLRKSARFTKLINQWRNHLFRSELKPKHWFALGWLNGFLPCGLVYVALAAALAGGHPLNGGIFMLFFGWGTAPALVALQWLAGRISQKVRLKFNRAVPYVVATMATLFILRGMGLGLGMLSPKKVAHQDADMRIECCHKPSP